MERGRGKGGWTKKSKREQKKKESELQYRLPATAACANRDHVNQNDARRNHVVSTRATNSRASGNTHHSCTRELQQPCASERHALRPRGLDTRRKQPSRWQHLPTTAACVNRDDHVHQNDVRCDHVVSTCAANSQASGNTCQPQLHA